MIQTAACVADAPERISLCSEVRLTRSGIPVRLIQMNGASSEPAANPSLIGLMLKARRWWAELKRGEVGTSALAGREKVSPSYVTRTVRLAFLAPDVSTPFSTAG